MTTTTDQKEREPMKPFQARLEKYQRKALENLSAQRQRSMNFLVCEAVDLLLEKNGVEIPENRKQLMDR